MIGIILGLLNQSHYDINPLIAQLKSEHKKQIAEKQQQEDEGDATDWEKIKHIALRLAKENDYPPSVLIGQMALETGHGTSYFARTRNNFCGLNAVDWNPNLAYSFASVEEGIQACIDTIKNSSRYAFAYANRNNPYRMISLIRSAGYATDPYYVQKVTNQPEFQEYLND